MTETQTLDVLLIASNQASGDEEALRDLLQSRSEEATEAVQYRLSLVSTIAEAVAGIETGQVDVILLDLDRPDAEEVIARMGQGVPIVLLADEQDAAAAYDVIARGAQDYLVKESLNRPWLLSALRMAIDRHEVRQQVQVYTDLLSISETRFRTIIEQNADGLLIVDRLGKISFTNQAAQVLLGRSETALQGAEWGSPLVAGSHAELDITRPDGSQVVVEMCVADIDWEGERALLATLRDVTERKAVQEALEQTAEELQRSNKELRVFADVASHDLRQPLRSTLMYLELLTRHYGNAINEEAGQWIDAAEQGIQRMWQLVDALLAYTRLNVEDLTLEPVDINEVLEKTLTLLKAELNEMEAVIIVEDLPIIRADASQMEQVFQNLIGNALKFRTDGTPHIHISATCEAPDWIFAVGDNGIGIEAIYAERIFDMFERLHTHEAYPGTGIGLAVCKKIITRHGGRIWVESKPEEGATFFFSLPAD